MRAALVLALASCGPASPNRMIDRASPLRDVGAPHVPILVATNEGLVRVYLDTGVSELVSQDQQRTIVVDPTTLVRVENDHYVIQREGHRIVVADVKAETGASLSPSRALLAFVHDIEPQPVDLTQPQQEIVTIAIADGTVRRYPVPVNGPPPAPTVWLAWAKATDTLLVTHDGWHELDLATGTFSPITKEDYVVHTQAPDPLECPARGVRLAPRERNKQQQIVLVPTASTADPEHLSATTDRVVVTASNHERALGMGGPHLGSRTAGPLQARFFTPSCEHFVFTLEGAVYVANVVTRAYARVIAGRDPILERH